MLRCEYICRAIKQPPTMVCTAPTIPLQRAGSGRGRSGVVDGGGRLPDLLLLAALRRHCGYALLCTRRLGGYHSYLLSPLSALPTRLLV